MRIAVLGAGPKALFCVERLIARGRQRAAAAPISIDVFDPAPPGAGAGYDPQQTSLWRLNVTAQIVSVTPAGQEPAGLALPTFDGWRRARGETTPLDDFPPRALVGRYFAEQWGVLATAMPSDWRLRQHRELVHQVLPTAKGWELAGQVFDQVLFATGHASDWSGALRHQPDPPPALVGQVYPEAGLARIGERVPVVSRGAALTFIDLALYLTEGRGGRFTDQPGGLAYRASGAEPPRLLPTARTGRFMVPKPDPQWLARLPLHQIQVPAARVIRESGGRVRQVLDEVERCASAYLELVGGEVAARLRIDDLRLRGLGRTPLDLLDDEIAVAGGQRTPDAVWALGQAWRDLYPAIVDALSFETSSVADWQGFARAAQLLEPIAFGPPLINARKLAALGRAGILDDFALASRADINQALQLAGPDAVLVDAVLPPPGVAETGPLAELVASGVLVLAPGRRGVRVDAELRCLAADATAVPGLSAVGRVTEDVVIGNDTLNRALHDGPDRWAARVLRETS